MNRRIAFLAASVFFLTGACSSGPEPSDDPRVGELGQLRFSSGCNSSTTMALGSKATVKLEPREGTLRGGLGVSSSDPGTISAEMGDATDEIDLRASSVGDARIAVNSGGEIYDAITFDVDVATAANYETVPRVFANGAVDVVVTDVFGACGTDECLLFGHSFLEWRSEPAIALPFVRDDLGTARFTAMSLDSVDVFAREPSTGRDLVAATVEIVSTDGVDGFRATLQTIPLEEGEESRSFDLPGGEVQHGEAFCVRIDALRGSEPSVPISRHDVTWQIEGDAIEAIDAEHGTEPLGSVFNTIGVGRVMLRASSHLFDDGASWELIVAAP
jgi:hypothetical protein